MLQSLPKELLSFRWQAAKCGIVLEFALLLRGRQVFVAAKPVPGMAPNWRTRHLLPRRRLPLWRSRMPLLHRMESTWDGQ